MPDMSYSEESLLPAAVLSAALTVGDYVGSGTEFIELIRSKWPGGYSDADVMFVIKLFSTIGDATLSDSGNIDDFVRVNAGNLRSILRNNGWKESQPALHYFSHFGEEWLGREWSRLASSDQMASSPSQGGAGELDVQAEDSIVDSSAWTGLPAGFVLTEEKRVKLVTLLQKAEDDLDGLDIGNEEKAQARAYIVAAKALADAPEPPVELIWQLIGRANSLAGIASLFVSIVALFT